VQLAAQLSHKVAGPVVLAYLELMGPPLDEAISALINKGATSIRVVPLFLGQGGHVKEDLPRLVERARKSHPQVAIALEPPIGEQPTVIDAIAAAIATGGKR
jgi:sirohydrochlorin cobaltochelatase